MELREVGNQVGNLSRRGLGTYQDASGWSASGDPRPRPSQERVKFAGGRGVLYMKWHQEKKSAD